jgi:serine/alanine racemase
MYMLLPLVMVCLFSLLLGLNRGERRSCRKLSSLIYVLHPWCIVLVRGGAEVLGLEGPLVENSMGHFLAVLASSAAAKAFTMLYCCRWPSR